MNPADPLQALGLLEKFVVEHGSAAVQGVHIELLRDLIETHKKENQSLKRRIADLEKECGILKETNRQLYVANKKLEAASTASDAVEEITLDPLEVTILKLLAEVSDYLAMPALVKALKVPKIKVDYHVGRLEELGCIYHNEHSVYPGGDVVQIRQPGRECLHEMGLLD